MKKPDVKIDESNEYFTEIKIENASGFYVVHVYNTSIDVSHRRPLTLQPLANNLIQIYV